MLIEQIIEFKLRGSGVLAVHVLLQQTKQKSVRNIFEWNILIFTGKILQVQCTLLPFPWAKSCTKFDPEMQDFKRVLDLNCK